VNPHGKFIELNVTLSNELDHVKLKLPFFCPWPAAPRGAAGDRAGFVFVHANLT
jgi:hypothetical protein